MGNSCICINANNYIKDIKINICTDKQSINSITEHIIKKEDTKNEQKEKRITQLKKYFNENEQEILNNIINQKEKDRKILKKKNRKSMLATGFDKNKYELMLKRLLEQKKIKRKGPKRRQTIRKSDIIKPLINEVFKENKKLITNNYNTNGLNKTNSTLIIKNNNNQNMRLSVTIDKEAINNNKKSNIKLLYFQNANTLNEMINDGSSGLCKKETNKK